MDDGDPWSEVRRLEAELQSCRRDAALVIHALDRSCQLIEALLAWLPDGQPLSPGLSTAHEAWKRAMEAVRGR
jgi:hypothetical protein